MECLILTFQIILGNRCQIMLQHSKNDSAKTCLGFKSASFYPQITAFLKTSLEKTHTTKKETKGGGRKEEAKSMKSTSVPFQATGLSEASSQFSIIGHPFEFLERRSFLLHCDATALDGVYRHGPVTSYNPHSISNGSILQKSESTTESPSLLWQGRQSACRQKFLFLLLIKAAEFLNVHLPSGFSHIAMSLRMQPTPGTWSGTGSESAYVRKFLKCNFFF